MILPDPITIAAAVAIGIVAVLGALGIATGWERRWLWPELLVVLVFGVILGLGGRPRLSAFDGVPLLLFALLAVLHTTGRALPTERYPLPVLGLASAVFGPLPVLAALLPNTHSASHAARLALYCTAIAAASPIGGPVQLLAASPATWVPWALIPALAAAAVAFPGLSESDRDAEAPEVSASRTGPRLLRWAFAAWILGGVARTCGVGLLIGEGLSERPMPVLAEGFYGIGLAAGAIGDPWVIASVLERAEDLGLPSEPERAPLLLGLVLAPTLPLALAWRAHGRDVLKMGVPVAAAQLLIGLAWVWWAA